MPAGTQMPEALRGFQDALQGAGQQVQNGEQVSLKYKMKVPAVLPLSLSVIMDNSVFANDRVTALFTLIIIATTWHEARRVCKKRTFN